MCNPMAWGAALAIAGTAATVHGQRKAEKAAVTSRRREDDRQKKLKGDAETAFAGNEAALNADVFKSKMGTAAQSREAAYAAANTNAPNSVQQAASSSLGGNKVVSDNAAQVAKGVAGRVGAHGAARAELGSFGDTAFDTSILTGRGREGIAQAGNFAQGSANVLPAELEAARHKGSKERMLGSVLTAVGTSIMGGAGVGAGAAGGGATAASAGSAIVPSAGSALAGMRQFYGTGSQGFVGPPG